MAKKEAAARIRIDRLLEAVDGDAVVAGDALAASRVALRVQEAVTLGLCDGEV